MLQIRRIFPADAARKCPSGDQARCSTHEKAVEFIADDELVELTPKSIRLRKRFLKEHDRKRAQRETESV